MKRQILIPSFGIVLLCAGVTAPFGFGQVSAPAGRTLSAPGAPAGSTELAASSRACADAARFLAQPKLAEALSAARANPKQAEVARQNPNGFLASHGVEVPSNVKVVIQPSGGSEAKLKIDVRITCCPWTITITLSL